MTKPSRTVNAYTRGRARDAARKNPGENYRPVGALLLNVEEHPAEDRLELFALRRLNAKEMWALLRHLDACPSCRSAVEAENEFIQAIRAALRDGR